jgi:hypothetical protein
MLIDLMSQLHLPKPPPKTKIIVSSQPQYQIQ